MLVNALAFAAAAAGLNDNYDFYASWGDLFSNGHQTVLHTSHSGAPATVALSSPVPGTAAVFQPRPMQRLPRGVNARHLQFAVHVHGRSGVTAEVRIALPPDYFSPQARNRRYPVIEAFHGVPGTDKQWLSMMQLPQALHRAVAKHELSEAIIVAPETEIPHGRDTECVDGGPLDPAVGTWLTSDVPLWVQTHLRADETRTGWATMGLSEGAWCAAYAAMSHPARYGAAVVLSGYFAPEFASSWVPFARGSAAYDKLDLVRMARLAPPPVALWVQTSKADRVSLPSSLAFARAARSPLSVQLVELSRAGHRAQVWRAELPGALQWLGRDVPGFAPGGAPATSAPATSAPAPVVAAAPRTTRARVLPVLRGVLPRHSTASRSAAPTRPRTGR
jgi:enterochelin esterase-like enzyme